MNRLPDNWRVSPHNSGLVVAGDEFGQGNFLIADASFSSPWGNLLPKEQRALVASLIAKIPVLLDALEEIAKGGGPFNRDPLIFAGNCVEHAVKTAKAALMEIGVEPAETAP